MGFDFSQVYSNCAAVTYTAFNASQEFVLNAYNKTNANVEWMGRGVKEWTDTHFEQRFAKIVQDAFRAIPIAIIYNLLSAKIFLVLSCAYTVLRPFTNEAWLNALFNGLGFGVLIDALRNAYAGNVATAFCLAVVSKIFFALAEPDEVEAPARVPAAVVADVAAAAEEGRAPPQLVQAQAAAEPQPAPAARPEGARVEVIPA